MSSFKIINDFLTYEEVRTYLEMIDDPNFVNHRSTITGEPSPLNFLPVEFRGIERVLLMKMEPHAVQDWHTDGKNLGRNCVIIHPLTDNYAHAETEDGIIEGTAILNTQKRHAVFNNESIRMNLQIPLNVNFDQLYECDDLIRGLYE